MVRWNLLVAAYVVVGCGTTLDHLSADQRELPEGPPDDDIDNDGWTPADGDCDDGDVAVHPWATEACNGLDDDCNGSIDDGVAITYFPDLDGDTWGNPGAWTVLCIADPTLVQRGGDCDDTKAAVHVGASEVCDELDNDCDGETDEGLWAKAFYDEDHDGYGSDTLWREGCAIDAKWLAVDGDCDDSNPDIHPGTVELCDLIDNDCNDIVDDALDVPWHLDDDGDGYGSNAGPDGRCEGAEGAVVDGSDCDDLNPSVHPGADELCNSEDDDCDGLRDGPDALDARDWYEDADGDGHGDAETRTRACHAPTGTSCETGDDCDDADSAAHPHAFEVCDGVDNDCDGEIDDGLLLVWYADADRDLYGDVATSVLACIAPAATVADATDCDDADHQKHPAAVELCDGVDNDCDDFVDDGVLGVSSGCAAEDCAAVLGSDPLAASGDYFLTAGVYSCEMDRYAGGWTQVKEGVTVDAAIADETAYNVERFLWSEVWFAWTSGTMSAGCDYPDDIAHCNPLGFRFGSEDWAAPDHGGAALCGRATGDYSAVTTVLDATDFIIARSISTDATSLAALEAVAACGLENNTGAVTMDIWVR